jgi:tripartite-type tricarboxylate transporter receptor subunit TctC
MARNVADHREKEDGMTVSYRIAPVAIVLATILAGGASGADYPTKPVQLMVAYPAGGSTDVAARVVASIAEKELGRPIIVVNKGGAGGQVGWTEMSRQRPDGYYLGFINLPALNTVILDPDRRAIFGIDAFVPIINQVVDPGVIWVKADSRFKSLKALIDAARKAPNTIKAATTGILSDDHLALLMVEEAAPGTAFRIVHFDGGAPQMTAVLGGHVDVAFDNVGSVVKRVASGEVRVLTVMDTQRSKFLPGVPTTVELGYRAVVSTSARGIAGPKGLPEPVVRKLQEVFARAMADPDHIRRMEDAGLGIKVMAGNEYGAFYRDQHERAKKYADWARRRMQRE